MYEPHGDTSEQKHVFPEPNTYDYASQLMFDANAFAAVSNQVDTNPTYMDFFHQGATDPYEMFRYQAAMQQSHDYASSCSSSNTPPSSYNQQSQVKIGQMCVCVLISNFPLPSDIATKLPTTNVSHDGIS